MKSNLTFFVNELGLVEGYMTHNGQEYRFLSSILATRQYFRIYFNDDGSLTYQGRHGISKAALKGRLEEYQVFNDYCFMLRIKAHAESIIEEGGAA